MAKIATDINQSKLLAEFLPLESADGYWDFQVDGYNLIADNLGYYKNDSEIPCWSLGALLSVLDFPSLTQNKEDEWEVCVPNHKSDEYIEVSADNPVDACVEMVEKLHELKML